MKRCCRTSTLILHTGEKEIHKTECMGILSKQGHSVSLTIHNKLKSEEIQKKKFQRELHVFHIRNKPSALCQSVY